MKCPAGALRPIAATLLGLFVVALLWPAEAEAQSRGRLQGRLQETKRKTEAARDALAQKRRQAAAARNELVEAQQDLAAAEARLARAQRRLETTRRELAQVREELERTKRRLAAHQDAMGERLLALFRSQEPSYAEVLLRATSFEDFANRAQFIRAITQQDEDVLIQIVNDKMKVEEQQRLLEEKEAEQEQLRAKVAHERAAVAKKAAHARALSERAQRDVKEAERQLDAMEAELKSIAAMLRRLASGGGGYRHSGAWGGSFLRPVQGRISSGYGWRIHPITRTRRFHDGIDIAAPAGTPIACGSDGTVVSTGWQGPYGLTVIVDHGSGVSTMYAHLQRGSIRVSPGQRVTRGQTLAGVGSTGWSTGPHLHWTVFKNGNHVNPFSL